MDHGSENVLVHTATNRITLVVRELMQRYVPMTPEQKTLVQDSFALIAPDADRAGLLFYDRLFQLDPRLRTLFHGDMGAQSRKLMHILAIAIKGLDDLEAIVPAVRSLGRRHTAYGVTENDFETVGAALLWTLEHGLGDAFNAQVREAWVTVYGVLAKTMQAGMQQARSELDRPAAAAA
jgi:hemoglobin-like flavoprotein